MEDYQSQSAKVITDLMNKFSEPSHIPALAEMCSKMLVLCAEQNFETKQPKRGSNKRNLPKFSAEHRAAFRCAENGDLLVDQLINLTQQKSEN